MTRRILTAEDVAAMEAGTRLVVDDATTVTGAARDLARRKNIVLVEDGEATGAQDTAAGETLAAR